MTLPTAYEHAVVKTLHIDPTVTGPRVVLYSGTTPTSAATDDLTLMVAITRSAGIAAKIYFTDFWIRYAPQAWGSVTGGTH